MDFDKKTDTFVGFCDGASLNLKGGWAYAFQIANHEPDEVSGAQSPASKNEMELTALAKLLKAIPEDAVGAIRVASSLVVHGITNWSDKWVANGWRKADGKQVENKHLWMDLLDLKARHSGVRYRWLEDRSDPIGVRVDSLASSEAMRAPAPPPPGVPVHLIETWSSGVRYEGHTIPEDETPPRFIIYKGSLYELDSFTEHRRAHPYVKREAITIDTEMVRRES